MADKAWMNTVFYGDNLDILGGSGGKSRIPDESVDLIYLDPPFNSKKAYNIFLPGKGGEGDAAAQIHAFDDTWHWSQVTERLYGDLLMNGGSAGEAMAAFHGLLGPTDLMAYLVMMTARLLLLKDVLKPTGSIYLHCDPTASHYLKVVMDSIYGPKNFRSEVVWKRTGAHGGASRWGPIHDVILFYSKSKRRTWNRLYEEYDDSYLDNFYKFADEHGRYRLVTLDAPGTRKGESGAPWRGVDPTKVGRHWAIPNDDALPPFFIRPDGYEHLSTQEKLDVLDSQGILYWPKKAGGKPQYKRYQSEGNPIQDIVTDIPPLHSHSRERLGFETQKPVALLERIIGASSNPGDVVLDPFCGCGTALVAAQKLGRRWLGIDIAYIAVDYIATRLREQFPDGVFTLDGVPLDAEGARALFDKDPHHFEFETWAVSLVHGTPKDKPGGDGGVDGRIRFPLDGKGRTGKVIISVKGGETVNPGFVRDLDGTVSKEKAEMGLLITRVSPTRGVIETAEKYGTYKWAYNQEEFPRIQVITIEELLAGKRPHLPPNMRPYFNSEVVKPKIEEPTLDFALDESG